MPFSLPCTRRGTEHCLSVQGLLGVHGRVCHAPTSRVTNAAPNPGASRLAQDRAHIQDRERLYLLPGAEAAFGRARRNGSYRGRRPPRHQRAREQERATAGATPAPCHQRSEQLRFFHAGSGAWRKRRSSASRSTLSGQADSRPALKPAWLPALLAQLPPCLHPAWSLRPFPRLPLTTPPASFSVFPSPRRSSRG